jgi:hypothetical protein
VGGSVPLQVVENDVVSPKQMRGDTCTKTFKIPDEERIGILRFDRRIEFCATGTCELDRICARITSPRDSLFQRGFMFLLIVVVAVSTIFLIGIYQLMLHKYYWGPSGKPPNPKKNDEWSS